MQQGRLRHRVGRAGARVREAGDGGDVDDARTVRRTFQERVRVPRQLEGGGEVGRDDSLVLFGRVIHGGLAHVRADVVDEHVEASAELFEATQHSAPAFLKGHVGGEAVRGRAATTPALKPLVQTLRVARDGQHGRAQT